MKITNPDKDELTAEIIETYVSVTEQLYKLNAKLIHHVYFDEDVEKRKIEKYMEAFIREDNHK